MIKYYKDFFVSSNVAQFNEIFISTTITKNGYSFYIKMLSLQGILLAIFIGFLLILWRRKQLLQFSSEVQGDNGFPLIGGLYKFIGIDYKGDKNQSRN